MRKIILLLIVLSFVSCTNSMNQIGRDASDAYGRMKKGDLRGYWELEIIYLDYAPEDFIPIAKYAADSLRYIPANFDVFDSYIDKYYLSKDSLDDSQLLKMSSKDREEALCYLEKAIKYEDTLSYPYKKLLKKY